MIPPLIVGRAQRLGLDLIAITDHHCVDNVAAVREAAEPFGIAVLAGMEVQSREEVHVICLFDRIEQAEKWQELIWAHLPRLPNREEFFGAQYVVDAAGDYVRTNERLLQCSTDLSFDELVKLAYQWGGLPIPAHVDRPTNSLFANLGMIPQGVALAGVEISRHTRPEQARSRFPGLVGLGMIQSGDAHRLDEIINTMRVTVASRSVEEIRLALLGRGGRGITIG